jgi:pimeloyl-ACP methyl ester carboxylesterase
MFSNGRKPNPMSWEGLAVTSAKSRVDEIKKLNIPTLVIHGDNDIWIGISHGKALADNIPNAKLFTVKGGGHFFPLLDKYNDYIVEMINHFKSK